VILDSWVRNPWVFIFSPPSFLLFFTLLKRNLVKSEMENHWLYLFFCFSWLLGVRIWWEGRGWDLQLSWTHLASTFQFLTPKLTVKFQIMGNFELNVAFLCLKHEGTVIENFLSFLLVCRLCFFFLREKFNDLPSLMTLGIKFVSKLLKMWKRTIHLATEPQNSVKWTPGKTTTTCNYDW